MPTTQYGFWYVGLFSGTLVQNATTTISIPFAQNTTFTLLQMRMRTNVDTSAMIEPLDCSLKMRDAGTGQEFTSDFVPRNCIMSSAKYGDGGQVPAPYVFAGNSTVVFDVRNDQGTALTKIEIILVGTRVNL